MGHRRRYFKVIRDFMIGMTLFAVLLSGTLAYLWRKDVIQTWAEGELVDLYVRKIKDKLPFVIEHVTVTRNGNELLSGKLDNLSLTVARDRTRYDLSGPLRFPVANYETAMRLLWKVLPERLRPAKTAPLEREIRIDYQPHVRISTDNGTPTGLPESFEAHLWVGGLLGATPEAAELSEAGIEADAAGTWAWSGQSFSAKTPHFEAHWTRKSGLLTAAFQARSLSVSRLGGDTGATSPDLTANIAEPKLQVNAPLTIQPFLAGSTASMTWSARSAEALRGDSYLSAGSEPLTGRMLVKLSEGLSLDQLENAPAFLRQLEMLCGGTASNPAARIRIDVRPAPSKAEERGIDIHFSTRTLPIRELVSGIIADFSSAGNEASRIANQLSSWHFRAGKAHLEASTHIRARLSPAFRVETHDWLAPLEANLELNELSFSSENAKFAASGGKLRLQFSGKKGLDGEAAVERIGFRHFMGALGPLRIRAALQKDRSVSIRIGDDHGAFPLSVQGVPLQLKEFTGTGSYVVPSGLTYALSTRLSIPALQLQTVTADACAISPKIPPAIVHVNFPRIDLSPGTIEFEGSVRSELFEGFIELTDLGFYDLDTEVPETDFSVQADGLRLDYINSFVNFGTMDGVLSASAKDVVLQSTLPTQYKIRLEAKPLRRSTVIFSADAMKNFARLFAADGIDALPGIADWFAFGLPSKILGGYNIDYAGIQLTSADGNIKVETLDPPEIVRRTGKHFILHGPRFKIPLGSVRYPLVVDAPAMENFAHQVVVTLNQLAEKKKKAQSIPQQENEESQNVDECQPPFY